MKNLEVCTTCKSSKGLLHCGICQEPFCKKCAQFVPEGSFSFLKKVPEELTHGIYCISCYNNKVAPELDSYEQTMAKAKNVFVYLITQSKEYRLIKSTEEPIKVVDCVDREETLLRLAFLAAQADFNTLIAVDIRSKKSTDTSYKTLTWSGTAIPVSVDADKMNRRY